MPDEIDNVLLIYMAGKANGLAGDMRKNIEDFCDGYVPEGFSRNILLTYEELTGSTGPTRSYLVRIYRHNGKTVRDTVVTYPVTSIGASRETLEDVLNETRRRFPGKGYGLLISSHGTGWLPKGYYRTSGNRDMASSDGRRLAGRQYDCPEWVPYEERWQDPSLPAVKSICQDVVLSDGMTVSYEMNIDEFAEAIPYHLDYIIMDCCFMGGVEIAYELKDVCDRIIFSPAEVLSLGFNYNTMGEHLLADDSPDLEGVARDYYEKYEAMSGTYQSATVTLVDCSGLATLAETCRQIFSSHSDQMEQLDIHIGDYVYVEKGGEIIPKITGVEVSKRPQDAVRPSFPTLCPDCGSPLVKDESEARHYCTNEACPTRVKGAFLHFISRKAMNINATSKRKFAAFKSV